MLTAVLAFFVRFSTRQEDEERAAFAAANIDTLRKKAERANADLQAAIATLETHRGATAA